MKAAPPTSTDRGQSTGISAGDSVSAVILQSAPSGADVRIRSGHGPRVLLVAHSSTCAGCRAYASRLESAHSELGQWDARLSVVVHEPLDGARALHDALEGRTQVLADPEFVLGRDAALLVTDEWGEVYFAAPIGDDHALPEPAEIAEWARFIAIQCPECEGPEGPWRTL